MLTKAKIGWEHPDDPGEPTTGIRRLSISGMEADILSALAIDCDVLEIGTGLGVSTRALLKYAEHVTSVDVDLWVAETIVPEVHCQFPGKFTFHDNLDALADHRFDLAFIDADHSTAAVARDLAVARHHSYEGSIIVCHDARYTNVVAALAPIDDWHIIWTEHGLAVGTA